MPRDKDLEESQNSIEFYDNCLAINHGENKDLNSKVHEKMYLQTKSKSIGSGSSNWKQSWAFF